jgi:hypothetical protein
VLGSPLAAVEAALDAGIGVRFAEHPTTFDGRQLSRIKLMSRPASGPAQRQGGTPSEPIVSLDTTKSASRKVNELSEQPTARRRRTPNICGRLLSLSRSTRTRRFSSSERIPAGTLEASGKGECHVIAELIAQGCGGLVPTGAGVSVGAGQ